MSEMSTIHAFLHQAQVPYSIVPHRPGSTAQEDAAATHVPGRNWAKVVICIADGEPIEAVIPAPSVVNLDRLLELTGSRTIRLADEEELRKLFPDCEIGAMPPLGPLYAHAVFVDVALAAEPAIVFSAGRHDDAIAMRWTDYARTVKPIVGRFADVRRDGVPAYRLSYRE